MNLDESLKGIRGADSNIAVSLVLVVITGPPFEAVLSDRDLLGKNITEIPRLFLDPRDEVNIEECIFCS